MKYGLLILLAGCTVNQGSMARIEGADFLSGDLRHFKAKSEGACRQECESNGNCVGYTYATPEAPAKNRGFCYLKREGFKFRRAKGFNSAIKR